MLELTPREVERIGEDRFLREKGRYWKRLIPLGTGACLAVIVVNYAKTIVPDIVANIIAILLVIFGSIPYFKTYLYDASKAGKIFRRQYEKERGMAGTYYDSLKEAKKSGMPVLYDTIRKEYYTVDGGK